MKSDYDKDADFNIYKIYSFEGWQFFFFKLPNYFDKKRVLDALKSEFVTRGMSLVENGAGMRSATTTYSDNDYTQRMLVVDKYDASGEKLVW